MIEIPAVVFAGGKSSRMGQDKALLPFEGTTLVSYQSSRLESLFERVYVSAKKDIFKDNDLMVIQDDVLFDTYAPTAGFLTMFRRLKAENVFFVLSVDAPFVDKSVIDALMNAYDGKVDAVIARTASGIHPLCGIYTRALEAPMLAMYAQNDHALGKLLSSMRVHFVDIDDERKLYNMNTPQEYQEALKS
ncbi:MAG: hypothetical protein KU37_10315 [Sulfuricurvum sp. PC08-66]|nr:MAG: hypothetical protein KU37_10315 [Sulfuricurvum sp. PC08-66]